MIEEKLESIGVKLPNPPTPAGSYVPVIRTGNLLFISGQIPMEDGKVKNMLEIERYVTKIQDRVTMHATKICPKYGGQTDKLLAALAGE